MRDRRTRTSANSAATKNPFNSTSTRTASRSRTVIGPPGDARAARRYFGRSRRRSCSDATMVPGLGEGQTVDAAREVEVTLRQTIGGMGAELKADLVPAVDQDVRMVVGGLRQAGHAVDERHRAR